MKICVAVLAVVLAVGYIEYTKAEDHETDSGPENIGLVGIVEQVLGQVQNFMKKVKEIEDKKEKKAAMENFLSDMKNDAKMWKQELDNIPEDEMMEQLKEVRDVMKEKFPDIAKNAGKIRTSKLAKKMCKGFKKIFPRLSKNC